jgi:tRNA1(Val) A37 N6-methylase TrmN6
MPSIFLKRQGCLTKKNMKTNDNSNDVIETTLLRGKVRLLQPKVGFHASLDTVFLAAAAPVKNSFSVLDVGCGVGSAGLCALARNQNMHLVGLDIQQELIDLALQNAALNEVSEHCHFFRGSLLTEKVIPDNYFNVVLMNPPYQEAGTHTPSPKKNKAMSHGEEVSGAKLQDWVRYAHRKLKNGGTAVMIHRADRLDDVIVALENRRWFGSLVVYPLWSKAGEDAKRVIIRARKERYAPMVLKPGLIIHEKDGQYTDGAQKILSAAEALDMD